MSSIFAIDICAYVVMSSEDHEAVPAPIQIFALTNAVVGDNGCPSDIGLSDENLLVHNVLGVTSLQ